MLPQTDREKMLNAAAASAAIARRTIMPDGRVSEAVEQAARRSYGRLLAFLAARSRDVTASEDCLADAFHAALTSWPRDGVPDNPEAWLLTVARRRSIDMARRATSPPAGGAGPHPGRRGGRAP